MADDDSFLLNDFSSLINYWIFLRFFVVLCGKSFFHTVDEDSFFIG